MTHSFSSPQKTQSDRFTVPLSSSSLDPASLQSHLFDQLLTGSTALKPAGEQFLRLRIGADVPVLLPVQQLTEVLSIPDSQIMPIPQMPAWMMGIYNWRGEILWIADLAHLCGLAPWYEYPIHRSSHAAVILNVPIASDRAPSSKGPLGLVVRQVEDMEWCSLDDVQFSQPPMIPAQLAAFAAGYWQKPDGTSLTILDGKNLLRAIG